MRADLSSEPLAFTGLGLADLESAAQSQAPWLWQGYLARGCVTMLTSQWKSGKTTSFLPSRNENAAGSMLEALMPLQVLTSAGMAVLILHHPRKGCSAAGQAARGSGALSGFVDILIEMEWYGPPQGSDRRRRLQAYSRFEETPRTQVIELTEDGGDYRSHGGFEEDELVQGWDQLRALLEKAPGKLTRQEILEQWPFEFHKPAEITLWRWLECGLAKGKVLQDGAGTRADPYRYWLPGKEEEWKKDPLYELRESMRGAWTR